MRTQHPLIREGMIAGAIGALVVAVWFLLLDLVHGRIFFTPAALGSAVFKGARSVDAVQRTAPMVLGYTLIHVVAFLIVGLIAAYIMFSADHEPRVLLGAGVAFVAAEVGVMGVFMLAAAWLLDALSFWTVFVGNILAAAAIGYYLYTKHPHVRSDLRTNLEERDLGRRT